MYDHLPADAFWRPYVPDDMPADPQLTEHRNLLDLQGVAAVSTIDRKLRELGTPGDVYALGEIDELLEQRARIMEQLRTGPHA